MGLWFVATGLCLAWAQFSTLHAQPAAPNYVLSPGGTNGFLELPGGAFNDLKEVTIEGWVKWMDDRLYRRFFDFGKAECRLRVTRLSSSPHFPESFDVRFRSQ